MSSASKATIRHEVREASQVGAARRAAVALAAQLGLDQTEQATVATVVTEAANNLVRHARDGEILLRGVWEGPSPAVEILAVDRGPGMANLAQCLRDGYSTGGTQGAGLGGILRMASGFDVYSAVSAGTVLFARCGSRREQPTSARPGPELGVVCVPIPGEESCGDSWALHRDGSRTRVMVVDGLGHGLHAAEAAAKAVQVFHERPDAAPAELIQVSHAAMRGTRGAAVAVADVDAALGTVRFAGVGNIAAAVCSAAANRSLVSYNGIVGHELRKVQEFSAEWPPEAKLVMHSDGLASRWSLESSPGLAARRPAVVAGVLYRDHRRGRDDVTVLVLGAPGRGRLT